MAIILSVHVVCEIRYLPLPKKPKLESNPGSPFSWFWHPLYLCLQPVSGFFQHPGFPGVNYVQHIALQDRTFFLMLGSCSIKGVWYHVFQAECPLTKFFTSCSDFLTSLGSVHEWTNLLFSFSSLRLMNIVWTGMSCCVSKTYCSSNCRCLLTVLLLYFFEI